MSFKITDRTEAGGCEGARAEFYGSSGRKAMI